MEEQDRNEKKTWLTSVIEELDAESTSSGAFPQTIENYVWSPS